MVSHEWLSLLRRQLPYRAKRSDTVDLRRAYELRCKKQNQQQTRLQQGFHCSHSAERRNSAMRAAHGVRIGKRCRPPAFAAVILFGEFFHLSASRIARSFT